jgi:aryl-alcohol dehydrogenase-like predicted oxidoreductase
MEREAQDQRVREIATEKDVTAGQLALAWLLAQGEDVVPIPGTRHPERLDENAAAAEIELSADDLRRIAEAAPAGVTAGDRYPDMSSVNR